MDTASAASDLASSAADNVPALAPPSINNNNNNNNNDDDVDDSNENNSASSSSFSNSPQMMTESFSQSPLRQSTANNNNNNNNSDASLSASKDATPSAAQANNASTITVEPIHMELIDELLSTKRLRAKLEYELYRLWNPSMEKRSDFLKMALLFALRIVPRSLKVADKVEGFQYTLNGAYFFEVLSHKVFHFYQNPNVLGAYDSARRNRKPGEPWSIWKTLVTMSQHKKYRDKYLDRSADIPTRAKFIVTELATLHGYDPNYYFMDLPLEATDPEMAMDTTQHHENLSPHSMFADGTNTFGLRGPPEKKRRLSRDSISIPAPSNSDQMGHISAPRSHRNHASSAPVPSDLNNFFLHLSNQLTHLSTRLDEEFLSLKTHVEDRLDRVTANFEERLNEQDEKIQRFKSSIMKRLLGFEASVDRRLDIMRSDRELLANFINNDNDRHTRPRENDNIGDGDLSGDVYQGEDRTNSGHIPNGPNTDSNTHGHSMEWSSGNPVSSKHDPLNLPPVSSLPNSNLTRSPSHSHSNTSNQPPISNFLPNHIYSSSSSQRLSPSHHSSGASPSSQPPPTHSPHHHPQPHPPSSTSNPNHPDRSNPAASNLSSSGYAYNGY